MNRVGTRWALLMTALAWGVGACDEDEGPLEPETGSIRVSVSTVGQDVDDDGYTVSVDGGSALQVDASAGVLVINNVDPGSRSVLLGDVAANCTVGQTNPLAVTVVAGDTAEAAFTVNCTGLGGDVLVRTITTGDSLDADGYLVRLGTDSASIGANDSVTFSGVDEGDQVVTLEGLAANCVAAADSQSVSVTAGALATAEFQIACAAPVTDSGTVIVTTTTTGDSLDVDGYTVTIGSVVEPIGINDTLSLTGIPAGTSTVTLSGLAANCTAAADTASITLAGNDSATADFSVTCQLPQQTSGTVIVSTTTTGDSVDIDPDGYTITVGGVTDSIGVNDTVTFSPVTAGANLVQLAGLASNCTAAPADTSTVTLVGNDTASVAFAVACTPPASVSQERIVFTTDRDGNDEIYIVQTDGTGLVNLSNDAAADGQAVWSPDSTRVAFRSERDGNGEIYVVNADGTGLVNLTNDPGDDAQPAWSPDGTRVAYRTDRDGNGEIYVINVDGTGNVNLTGDAGDDSWPTFSFDGTQIAFATDRDGNSEVYTMDVDGQNQTNLSNDAGKDTQPAWSRDGTQLAWVTDRDGNDEIYVGDADGANAVNVSNDAGADSRPSWSPDGSALTFGTDRDGNGEIYWMNADGTGAVNLTNDPANDRDPSWGVVR